MYKLRSRGFTLIELLVVIAIIGILSAVVLASLSTARTKGQDAAVQSDLNTIQTQAEIYYGGTGVNSYGAAQATCSGSVFSDPTIIKAIAGTDSANGSATPVCGNSTTAYAAMSQLPTSLGGTASYWCVDSTGFAGVRVTALVAGDTVCPAT